MSNTLTIDSHTATSNSQVQAWVVCISAGLFFFYEFFQLNFFDVINEPLRQAFQISGESLSWMSSTYLWADIIFLIPAGILLDRYSVRLIISAAMFVCVLGTVGFATTSMFWFACFCHFLSGIGNAFCFLSCVVLVSRWFVPRRQALVIGCLVTMAFLGAAAAHTPLVYLVNHFGWRNSLLIDALVGVVLFVWIIYNVKDYPPSAVTRARLTNQGHHFKKSFFNAQNWLAGVYTSCLNLPILVLGALWGAQYLQVVHNMPLIKASYVATMIFFGSMLGCPLAGYISDKLGRRKSVMVYGALLSLLAVSPLCLNIPLSNTTLIVIFFAIGFFTSTQVISYPLIAESNDTNHTGSATSIASVLIMGGGGVAQVLFGYLMGVNGHDGNLVAYTHADFQVANWMFPLAFIGSLITGLCLSETYCKSKPKEM